MCTKTLKSMLEQKYDDEVSRYRKTMNCPIEDKPVDQARIRLLEDLLFEMFEISHEFDFSNID